MPLNANISGQIGHIKDKDTKYLTEDQARHICEKVELGRVINTDTIKQEMEQALDRMADTSGEKNLYHYIKINKAERDNTILLQMEQWSTLGNVVNYIQYDRHHKHFYNLDIKAVEQRGHKKKHNKEEERQMLELGFGNTPEKLKGEYLDVYEGIQSEILSTTRFDDNSDLGKTYLRRVDITRTSNIKVEERFPISEQGNTVEKLLDETECQILLDTGASKSFMFKSQYLHCKSRHSLPEFTSKIQRIQVWNGQFISVFFIISTIIDIHRHRF